MRLLVLAAQLWMAAQPSAGLAPLAGVWWSPALHVTALSQIDARLHEALPGLPKAVVNGKRRALRSCADVIEVSRQKFRLSPDDDVSWRAFETQAAPCVALEALKTAKPAARSFVAWFHLTPESVAKLPPDMTLYFSEDEQQDIAEAAKECQPLGVYDGSLEVQPKGDQAEVSTDSWTGQIVLYARGDLNGDGIEDLMLLRQAHSNEGSAADASVFIVTQNSTRGCLQVLRTLPDGAGKGARGR